MSSICGIIDFESSTVNFERFRAMSRAGLLRGKDQSGAYLNGGIAIGHGRMIFSGGHAERQPYTKRVGGRLRIIAFDGVISNSAELAESLSLPPFKCSAEAVLEAYEVYGNEVCGYLQGIYAFVIYDEYKKELFLARDPYGAKPLYYTFDEKRLIYASEIKALLAYSNEPEPVERAALEELLLSPVGSIRSVDIYRNIDELPAGCFAVYSRLGFQISSCGALQTAKEALCANGALCGASFSFSGIDRTLIEALYSFDRPCFDEYMAGDIQAIKKNSGMRSIVLPDRSCLIDRTYSRERADRLGMANGVMVYPIEPEGVPLPRRSALRGMEKQLAERVGELLGRESAAVFRLFSKGVAERIAGERDVCRRVRAYGMLLQSEEWLNSYRVVTV